jgi:hypothetical protein
MEKAKELQELGEDPLFELTLEQLQERLRCRSLPVSGKNKGVLVVRLRQSLGTAPEPSCAAGEKRKREERAGELQVTDQFSAATQKRTKGAPDLEQLRQRRLQALERQERTTVASCTERKEEFAKPFAL